MQDTTTGFVGPPHAPDTYRLIAPIRTGGEGQVWRAVIVAEADDDRPVAVKFRPLPETPGSDQAWERQSALMRRLSHPAIVPVRDAFRGSAPHRRGEQLPATHQYIVMDLIVGVPLTEWRVEHPEATFNQLLEPIRMVASGLDYLHNFDGSPVTHGDVKPSNVVVRPDGSAVLVDLGLVSQAGGDSWAHSRGYVAPEVLRRQQRPSPSSDAYSFAVLAAVTIAGRQAPVTDEGLFDNSQLASMMQRSRYASQRPNVTPTISRVLDAASEQRPTNLCAWTELLASIDGPPTVDGPDGVVPLPAVDGAEPTAETESKSRNPLLIAALVLVFVAIAASAYAIASQLIGSRPHTASGQLAGLGTSGSPSSGASSPTPRQSHTVPRSHPSEASTKAGPKTGRKVIYKTILITQKPSAGSTSPSVVLSHTAVATQNHPKSSAKGAAAASTPATAASTATTTHPETTGGTSNTWSNYENAGGSQGPSIPGGETVQISCKVTGFQVADGNSWWYRIASSPWLNSYYVSADAFYNNGETSGSLQGTPFVDPQVPNC